MLENNIPASVWAGEKPDDELNGEPGHVDGLQDLDYAVRIC